MRHRRCLFFPVRATGASVCSDGVYRQRNVRCSRVYPAAVFCSAVAADKTVSMRAPFADDMCAALYVYVSSDDFVGTSIAEEASNGRRGKV